MEDNNTTTTVAVIGFGYWGPNIARNFYQLQGASLKYVCDKSEEKRKKAKKLYGDIQVVSNLNEILEDPTVDAIALATPVCTHYTLGKRVLEFDKHLFVEKPITQSLENANELVKIQQNSDKIIMVGHTFEYAPAVNKIKSILERNELGNILYIHSRRLNLGLYQEDINVVWDLAPHDISILNFLFESTPSRVSAKARRHAGHKHEDVSLISLTYPNDTEVYLHLSWLDPKKERQMTIVGDEQMLVYDDVKPREKIKIYEKGIEKPPEASTYAEWEMSYRYGDINIPRIEGTEPLRVECDHFISSIQNNTVPRTDSRNGRDVVAVLEGIDRAIHAQKDIELSS